MTGETVIRVSSVSKKFCRSLKHTMMYGVADLARNFMGLAPNSDSLRSGEFWAVDDISFELKRGECIGLIGPNGSGKSTLLKMLNGIFMPDCGEIRVDGRVGALIEVGAGFHPMLTGRENVYVGGAILGMSKKEVDEKFDKILEFADIGDFIDSPVKHYSSGMFVRLGFAVAAHLKPDVLLIDEVIAVGDAAFRMKCYDHILRLMEHGTSIILVTHGVEHLSRVTNRAIVLNKSKLVFDGSLADGVGKYHFCSEELRKKSLESTEQETFIDKVRVEDSKGEERDSFITGETICVTIEIKSTKPVRDARLIGGIVSPTAGCLGTFATTFTNFGFDILPPKTKIKLYLREVPLLVGGYYLNLNLYGPKITDFYHQLEPAVSFRIVGPPINAFGYGVTHLIRFEHSWCKL